MTISALSERSVSALLPTPLKVSFRLATPGDLAIVTEIYRSACEWLHDVKGITDQWEREVSAQEMTNLIGSNELYLAFLNAEAIGAFKLKEQDKLWERDGAALYIHELAVHRKFAGRGLGTHMLDWAGALARQRGKHYLRLDCSLPTPPARDYVWRPYRREDVPALYQMLLAADRADDRQSNMTEKDMELQFDDPWSNPETDSLLAFTTRGQLAAMARVFVNPRPEEECRAHVWG